MVQIHLLVLSRETGNASYRDYVGIILSDSPPRASKRLKLKNYFSFFRHLHYPFKDLKWNVECSFFWDLGLLLH